MSLEAIVKLLGHACRHKYAVGYFESWNLESLAGVIDAAERTRSPIIVGFNGDFLSHAERLAPERIEWYGALGRAAAESAGVPCGLIFNECASDACVRRAIDAGFNLVMPADEHAAHGGYVHRVAELTRYAHSRGVAVEAEVGQLPSSSSAMAQSAGCPTDPNVAARFVAATGVDLLSVSIGNVHVLLEGQHELDLARLAAIRERVAVPLGLHGGTGIPADSLRKAIAAGIAKVAYGTYLKQRYLAAVRAALRTGEPDPHRLLGYGGGEDVLLAGRRAVCDAVLERIELLGCCGMA